MIEAVDPASGDLRIYFEEDGDVIEGVKQDDTELRKQVSEASSSEDSESESEESDSASDSESDDEQHEQVAERRRSRGYNEASPPAASAGARLGASPSERAERLSFILANSPALLKR